MEKEQEIEWAKAQNIAVSVDLLEAAKKQLEFLAVVDRNRYLYESPALEWAIYRYNAFWLPLLAKHSENAVSEDPLVVPLDCEWIWHCHRLNPVRYKSDCEERFGRILGNHNIISSVQGKSKSKTEELWNKMYPEESYELDCNRSFPGDSLQRNVQSEKFTSYDLVSAVKRQVPFSFQVARPHMSDDLFLQEAVARYKGFLHLIRTNRKNNIKRFCVPTYDVDLIWHTHQLNPVSYCNDLLKLIGKVLEHDDTDSDRTKGKKLDTGFSDTTKQWEDTFGLRYWKAGAMYRGATPTPVTQIPIPFTYEAKKLHAPDICDNFIQFPEMKAIEVLLEFVEIKNLPEAHKGNIHVSFSKKQPDKLFSAKRTLSILSESGEKQVAYFQCEPAGEFLFELDCQLPSNIPLSKSLKPFGSCSLSLQECMASGSQLTVNKWLPVVPLPGILASKPILLHVSLSFTLSTSAVQVFHLLRSQPFFKSSCYFPLPKIGKTKHAKSRTCITDDDGNDVLNLQMRESSKDMTRSTPELLKEVHYITDSGETHTLAEFQGNEWLIKGTHGSFKLRIASGKDDHLFELVGHKTVKLFAGRRLDFEPKHCKKQSSEQDFMTAVEFSAEYPYGRATALIDFKNGIFKVKDEWMILTGITLAFILSDILKRKGSLYAKVGSKENTLNQVIQVTTSPGNAENVEAKVEASGDIRIQGNSQSGGCGSGCGSGCGNMVQSGGCGSGCGSGCGNMVQSGGCGSGCGNMVKSGGCGSGCGSGCGNMVQSGGCGSGCGSGCGNMVQSGGGCGSGCGGGCKGFGGCGGGCKGFGGCGGGCGHMVKSGGCGGSGGCGSGCGGNNLSHNDNVGACDLPKVEASIVNEPVAA